MIPMWYTCGASNHSVGKGQIMEVLTGERKNAITKVSYTHDAMIDLIIANPSITQGQLAAHFQYTQGWISQIMSSDAWKARLAERKGDLSDPTVVATVNERLEGLARQSLQMIQQNLDMNPGKVDVALKALEISTRALGYGANAQSGVNVQVNNVVAFVPEKVASGEVWEKAYRPPAVAAG